MLEMETALAILKEAGIRASQLSLEPLKEGPLNKIYKLTWESGFAVLWMDGNSDLSFERRSIQLQWVYSQMTELNLPVPQIIYPTTFMPGQLVEYLLLTYLPGEQLGKVLSKSDPKQQLALADLAGKALANMHKTTTANIENIRQRAFLLGGKNRYGNPFEPGYGAGGWVEHVENQLETQLKSLRKITSTLFIERIARFVEDRRSLWAAPGHWGKVGLVHNDFTPNNILVQPDLNNTWAISGIVDFEWSLIGPPEMDFAKLEAYGYPQLETNSQTQAYQEAFLNGYGQIEALRPNHAELVAVYKLLFFLFWTNLENSWGNTAGVKNTLQQIKNIL